MSNIKKRYRLYCIIGFLIYMAALVYYTVFAESLGRQPGLSAGFREYNLELFSEIKRFWYLRRSRPELFWSNLIGNMLAFVPFGFLLPQLFKNMKNVFRVAAAALIMSLTIESAQYMLNAGIFDVDDLLLSFCLCQSDCHCVV